MTLIQILYKGVKPFPLYSLSFLCAVVEWLGTLGTGAESRGIDSGNVQVTTGKLFQPRGK